MRQPELYPASPISVNRWTRMPTDRALDPRTRVGSARGELGCHPKRPCPVALRSAWGNLVLTRSRSARRATHRHSRCVLGRHPRLSFGFAATAVNRFGQECSR